MLFIGDDLGAEIIAMLRLESTSGVVSRIVNCYDPILAVPVGSLVNQRDTIEGISIPRCLEGFLGLLQRDETRDTGFSWDAITFGGVTAVGELGLRRRRDGLLKDGVGRAFDAHKDLCSTPSLDDMTEVGLSVLNDRSRGGGH